jgi:hypothetical protein
VNKLILTLTLLFKRLLSRFPSRLPVGKSQYDKFESDVLDLSGRFADETSMRFALASMMIHAPSDKGSLSKNYFVVRLRKSAANQVASQVFQDIKLEQEKARTVTDTTAQTVDVPTIRQT